MLAIRMQRTGRKGSAQFRVVVQESRFSPTSGRVVALLGNYDPHTKTAQLNSEKASYYLTNGAQPSTRIIRLFKQEGITLPKWVSEPTDKSKSLRNPEKLRKNQPKEEPAAEAPAEPEATEAAAPEAAATEAAKPEQTEATTEA